MPAASSPGRLRSSPCRGGLMAVYLGRRVRATIAADDGSPGSFLRPRPRSSKVEDEDRSLRSLRTRTSRMVGGAVPPAMSLSPKPTVLSPWPARLETGVPGGGRSGATRRTWRCCRRVFSLWSAVAESRARLAPGTATPLSPPPEIAWLPPAESGVAGLRPLPPHSISHHPFGSVRALRKSEGGGCPPPRERHAAAWHGPSPGGARRPLSPAAPKREARRRVVPSRRPSARGWRSVPCRGRS